MCHTLTRLICKDTRCCLPYPKLTLEEDVLYFSRSLHSSLTNTVSHFYFIVKVFCTAVTKQNFLLECYASRKDFCVQTSKTSELVLLVL